MGLSQWISLLKHYLGHPWSDEIHRVGLGDDCVEGKAKMRTRLPVFSEAIRDLFLFGYRRLSDNLLPSVVYSLGLSPAYLISSSKFLDSAFYMYAMCTQVHYWCGAAVRRRYPVLRSTNAGSIPASLCIICLYYYYLGLIEILADAHSCRDRVYLLPWQRGVTSHLNQHTDPEHAATPKNQDCPIGATIGSASIRLCFGT